MTAVVVRCAAVAKPCPEQFELVIVMRQISESDWKLFRQLHALALERFCARVLSEVGQLAVTPAQSAHEGYLAVFHLIQDRNKELAEAFDDFRRSTAWRQLALLRFRGLVTDEEFARFSPETRDAVQVFLGA
jgi:hypothetical protein